MKMMHGAFACAWAKRSRTRAAPTPTNISTNSEPESEKNGTPASPATARASSVLPVPGGPTRSTPLGMRPPSLRNFSGVLEELDDLPELVHRLVDAGHVVEADARVGLGLHPRAGLPEAHDALGALPEAAGAHPPHHEGPEDEAEHQRQAPDPERLAEPAAADGLVLDLLRFQRRTSSGSSTRLAIHAAVDGSLLRDGMPATSVV